MQAVTSPKHPRAARYPNAADRHYFLDRLASTVLSAAICLGVVTIGFFLITMF